MMLRCALACLAIAAGLPAAAKPQTSIHAAALSADLYFEGLSRSDPLLMLAAAQLRKPIDFQRADRSAAEPMAGLRDPLGWQEMLDMAEVLAVDDSTLLGLIDDVRAQTDKGMASGPFYNIAILWPGTSETYPAAEFRGGDYAEAYVEAAADTDLNISVFDAAGNLVCADSDPSPIAYCTWRPAQTGTYVLKVENLGPGTATYSLMTN